MATLRAIGWGLSAALFTGCAGSVTASGTHRTYAPDPATITVINQNADNIRVYIDLGSTSYPLGRIDAFQRRTLRIPRAMSNSLVTLRIQTVGSRQSFTVDEVAFDTHRQFELWVANRLRGSRISIR